MGQEKLGTEAGALEASEERMLISAGIQKKFSLLLQHAASATSLQDLMGSQLVRGSGKSPRAQLHLSGKR